MPDEEKKAFWSSMPGILSGLAADITAVTGLLLLFNKSDNSNAQNSSPISGDSANVSQQFDISPVQNNSSNEFAGNMANAATESISQLSWPLIKLETFNIKNKDWWTGEVDNDASTNQNEAWVDEGTYNWDLTFTTSGRWEYLYPSYQPAVNYYLAADVQMLDFQPTKGIGLLFGLNKNQYYMFIIWSTKSYSVARWDGQQIKQLVPYTDFDGDVYDIHHLAMVADNSLLKFYIDSKFAGEIKDNTYSGGQVGIVVYGWDKGYVSTSFDNFEFRSKPD